FSPFDMVKWLGLGFTAWLSLLGSGSPVLNFGNFWNKDSSEPLQAAWNWTLAHLALVISLAACIGVCVLAVSLAVAWVASRGKFMFLDNVIHNRAEIVKPWERYRTQGNSYFLFSVCLGLASLAVLGAIILISTLIAMPDITRQHFGANAISAIVLGLLLFLVYGITLTAVMLFLEDFIVPIMALRSCRALTAWSLFFDLFKAHTGVFILYLLFRIVLGWAVGAISLVFCCFLCCVMWIPYVNTVIVLPLFVFVRCYSIHFLEQFGNEYRLFERESTDFISVAREPPPTPA
ncbi:MAG: hypothetical protein KKE37_08280, partial [Verrucomicrobia bacterium]|nr:hypothetical protein [Verrucomicrobiota bacterium]